MPCPPLKRILGTQSGQADNLHPNVETPQAAAIAGFAPAHRHHHLDANESQKPARPLKHRAALAPSLPHLPCHDKAGQRRPGRRSACTHPLRASSLSLASGLRLTHAQAQRKRTDDDESPLTTALAVWLLLAGEIEPLASGHGRAPRPKGHGPARAPTPSVTLHGHAHGGVAGGKREKKIGAPLRCVVGAPSIKRE